MATPDESSFIEIQNIKGKGGDVIGFGVREMEI